ncbi:nuclear transport factor 2 family protein [Hoeflea sp. YIM 152468]|uniref:nuclear transport factor 2 family protein n=1 Tax=Hoeflea sp. YIM 152468 TaxID=3031759 RepID=UPI0023DA1291|nr:nuclear transport factor 2 family protein [Hoeflea sp. YIM 152468]MDF1608256.1 nuclear transport factor 2 family protein [Hoeflea sp. YIM 152468]
MVTKRSLISMLVVGVLIAASPATAQSSLLDRWYTALFDVNRVAIADLLADDAVITLEDLDVTQTKTEFIESLDEWEEVAKDANLAWQLEEGTGADATKSSVLVCYQFPDNEMMIREVFTFADGKIARSVQTTVSDSCENF